MWEVNGHRWTYIYGLCGEFWLKVMKKAKIATWQAVARDKDNRCTVFYFMGPTVAMPTLLTGCLTSLLAEGLKTLFFQKIMLIWAKKNDEGICELQWKR